MIPIDAVAGVKADPQRAQPAPARPTSARRQQGTLPTLDLGAAVESLNRNLRQEARDLHFSVDSSTGKTVVRLVNTDTGEIVRQMPSEEALEIARAIDHSIGLILNEKA